MKVRARLWADRSGVASLEFAAAGLTIMLLLLATFDVATLFMAKRGLDLGINRAARWSAVNSSSLSPATVLSQFQAAAAAALPNASSCQGYASGASVPASATCWVVVTTPSGVGGIVTIQANYKWSPADTLTGLVATTLQSTVALTVQH